MSTQNKSMKLSILAPAVVKFSMEMVTWVTLLILTFTNNILFITLFFVSILFMAIFTFPGDKAHDGLVLVPGWIRIPIELVLVAFLGMISCFLLFGLPGLLFQSLLVLLTIILEFKRYLWMLGFKSSPPEYVTYFKNWNK